MAPKIQIKLHRAGKRIARTCAFERIDRQPSKTCFVLVGDKTPDIVECDEIVSAEEIGGRMWRFDRPLVVASVDETFMTVRPTPAQGFMQKRYGTVIVTQPKEVPSGEGS